MTSRPSSDGPAGRGRPRVSSREVLEEAACELFLEQGYDGTTVAEIARRAGVSRGTFFNYFPAKSDVFWGDLDAALTVLPAALRAAEAAADPRSAVRAGLLRVADEFGPDRVPWILTQFEAMGSPGEVGLSALARLNTAAETLAQFVAERTGTTTRALAPRAIAYAALGEAVAAAQAWAERGPSRGRLSEHLALAHATE